MKIEALELEKWFRQHYFDSEIILCVSGVEEYTIGELREIIHLSQNEMDSIVLLDSPSYGCDGIRQAIARRWIDGKTEHVLVTHGSSEAIFLVMNALLCPGDEVVVLTPCYQPLFSIPRAIGCQVKFWQLRSEQMFTPDLEELSRLVTSRTRMLVVNFPNNPTGVSLTMEQQHELIRIAARHGSYLFWDAAFVDLTYNTPPLPDPSQYYERTITVNTLTKSYGLGGLRVGWCLADPAILKECVTIRDHITLNLSPLIEYLAERVVIHLDTVLDRRLKQARINHKILTQWLTEHQGVIECVIPQGGVSALIKLCNGRNAEAFCQRLAQEQGVFLLPGSCFGHSEFVRLGFGRATSELVEGLSRISRLLNQPSQCDSSLLAPHHFKDKKIDAP